MRMSFVADCHESTLAGPCARGLLLATWVIRPEMRCHDAMSRIA